MRQHKILLVVILGHNTLTYLQDCIFLYYSNSNLGSLFYTTLRCKNFYRIGPCCNFETRNFFIFYFIYGTCSMGSFLLVIVYGAMIFSHKTNMSYILKQRSRRGLNPGPFDLQSPALLSELLCFGMGRGYLQRIYREVPGTSSGGGSNPTTDKGICFCLFILIITLRAKLEGRQQISLTEKNTHTVSKMCLTVCNKF